MEHLIPEEWFVGLHWSILMGMSAVLLFVLMTGADWLVKGASGLAFRMGLPKVIVGATIVSLGTTAPECAVSVMAAWNGEAGLALGNAVGSIIADTGLIFGLGCLLVALPADRYLLSRQGWVQFGSAVLLAGICYWQFWQNGSGAQIGREIGILFLCLLGCYLAISVKWSRQHPHPEIAFDADDIGAEHLAEMEVLEGESGERRAGNRSNLMSMKLVGYIVAGLIVVVFSSHCLIHSVAELARQFHVPQVVIAATLVAFGTSLPELVVGLTSLRRGHPELLVGNVIGADVLNVLFVIGASAFAKPLPIVDPTAKLPEIFLYIHLPAMLLILFLFRIFIVSASSTGHFKRPMGVPMVVIYLGYVLVQYFV